MENKVKHCANKECKQNNPQPVSEFYPDKYKKNGYRSRCRACEIERAAVSRAKNRELFAKRQAEYYKRSGDVQRQASRNWKSKNKDKQKSYWQKWYEENRKKRADYHRHYQTEKPEVIIQKSRKRRNAKNGARGTFTEAEFQEILEESNYRCFWCDKQLVDGDITRDHYIPLTRGGSDYIDNIVPACVSCNCKKRNKLPYEFKAAKAGNLEPSRWEIIGRCRD